MSSPPPDSEKVIESSDFRDFDSFQVGRMGDKIKNDGQKILTAFESLVEVA